MKYLLDTNIFIILITDELEKLGQQQIEIIFDDKNEFLLSEASFFEIAIKVRLGKSNLSHFDFNNLEIDRKRFNIKLLKAKLEYYLNIKTVPKVFITETKIHSDPFDLLIISQAISENIAVLSTDRLFPLYEGISVIS